MDQDKAIIWPWLSHVRRVRSTAALVQSSLDLSSEPEYQMHSSQGQNTALAVLDVPCSCSGSHAPGRPCGTSARDPTMQWVSGHEPVSLGYEPVSTEVTSLCHQVTSLCRQVTSLCRRRGGPGRGRRLRGPRPRCCAPHLTSTMTVDRNLCQKNGSSQGHNPALTVLSGLDCLIWH